MKDTVVIKSFPNGIMLHMDQDADFNNILEELSFKFTEARNFFGNASMALAIEGRTLSPAEEILVLETIRNSSSVNVVCIVGKDETTNKKIYQSPTASGKEAFGRRRWAVLQRDAEKSGDFGDGEQYCDSR